ncbi:hypothetical protein DIURU_001592 [Diutina rugosa]|uniref:Uncharacterized protein n=1 Tax=Diutina rugosa TaxID=5481 RepID=A0A642UTC9_DIURU|nr:uncharacterized protein DIURU_001592 [Diutina rugosa]KAA8905164.1 hypothetical protein DIURU_001592 [Diutina rugosa]
MMLTVRPPSRYLALAVGVVLMVLMLVVLQKAKVVDMSSTLEAVVMPQSYSGPAIEHDLGHKLANIHFSIPELSDDTIHMYGDDECEVENVDIRVSPPTDVDESIESILVAWQRSKSTYFQEISTLINKDHNLDDQLREGTISKHWYRFAGSSVWLEDYRVHMMISRLIYTPSGNKQTPLFSLTLVHLYDPNWKPVEATLAVPDGYGNWHTQSYPQIVPIPFYHDVNRQNKRYYGPEDPRILMVNNEEGYQEPMLVFNMHTEDFSVEKTDKAKGIYKHHRSMYVAWPWQTQEGKGDIDNGKTKTGQFTRTSRLSIDGERPKENEKNWTPFIDGHNSSVYFVYRWDRFEVLECPLGSRELTKDATTCQLIKEKDSGPKRVGALRGGTELLSFASLGYPEASGWLGIARAHLKDCGCSPHMYRPNIVVIDRKPEGEFYLRAVSGFADWKLDVAGFYDDDAKCGQSSVLIPNGFSRYHPAADLMEVTYSIADKTVSRLSLQGLVSQLANFGKGGDVLKCGMDASWKYCDVWGDKYGEKKKEDEEKEKEEEEKNKDNDNKE